MPDARVFLSAATAAFNSATSDSSPATRVASDSTGPVGGVTGAVKVAPAAVGVVHDAYRWRNRLADRPGRAPRLRPRLKR
jgi:hypothetical protein